MKVHQHTFDAILALESHYGRRFFCEERHIPVWEDALGHRDPKEVERAVGAVIKHHTHGAPGLAEIRQALDGKWETRKVARTDAHCIPSPQTLGYEHTLCLVEYGTGRILRSFNERGDLIEWGSQRLIASAGRVDPALKPPAGALESLPPAEIPQLDQYRDEPGGPDRVDFSEWGA